MWDPKENRDTDARKFDSSSRSSLPTLSQKVHGSFAFRPCSGKVEALLKEQKIGIGIWDPQRYMVPLPFWPCFGKVEALLRKKGDIQMWDPKENGDTDRHRND